MELSESELAEIKSIELELLREFVRICNKHKISYVLAGGTCLGAIRHKGFIPWDDDIDVSMTREDYDRFAEVVESDLDDAKFVFQSIDTEPNCGFVFGKLRRKDTILSEDYSYHIDMSQGVWIDIFPYDRVPNDKRTRALYLKMVSVLKHLYIVKCGYRMPEGKSRIANFAYYFAKAFCSVMPLSLLIGALNKTMRQYENDSSCQLVYPFGGAYGEEVELIPRTMVTTTASVSFEGEQYLTFADYDTYLTKHYGDYMKLPPVEKRVGGVHHLHEFRSRMN